MNTLKMMAVLLGITSMTSVQAFSFNSFDWSTPNMNWGTSPSWSSGPGWNMGPNMNWGWQRSWNNWNNNPMMSWGSYTPYPNQTMPYPYMMGFSQYQPGTPYTTWNQGYYWGNPSNPASAPMMQWYVQPFPPVDANTFNTPLQPPADFQATPPAAAQPNQPQFASPTPGPMSQPMMYPGNVNRDNGNMGNGTMFPNLPNMPPESVPTAPTAN